MADLLGAPIAPVRYSATAMPGMPPPTADAKKALGRGLAGMAGRGYQDLDGLPSRAGSTACGSLLPRNATTAALPAAEASSWLA